MGQLSLQRGIDLITREMAKPWEPSCEEYFTNYQKGFYDQPNSLQLILRLEDSRIDADRGDLVFGHAGVNGIYFCFRQGLEGVFAYYPITDEYVAVSPTIGNFLQRWNEGSLTL
jgi:hypothetical protein